MFASHTFIGGSIHGRNFTEVPGGSLLRSMGRKLAAGLPPLLSAVSRATFGGTVGVREVPLSQKGVKNSG